MRSNARMANRQADGDLRFEQVSAPSLQFGLAGFAWLGLAWLGLAVVSGMQCACAILYRYL